MKGKPKKNPRRKDITGDYLRDAIDEDRMETGQRFSARNKNYQRDKTMRTTLMRAQEQLEEVDPETLPTGAVVQVFSLYSEIENEGKTYLAVMRKTLAKVSQSQQIVGDLVRFRAVDETEAVIEQILPRRTVLARADSFKAIEVHPIVANAEQMLIVASIHQPNVKWGLVDRMIAAAQSGGLRPIICLNKIDLRTDASEDAQLQHYGSLNITTLRTSVADRVGLDELAELLRNRVTVLAGHSGVGKSSLIRAIQPSLDLRIGAVSRYTDKGRHTTSFARSYPLEIGGHVIDTPGVKLFGLWGVTRETLIDFFPDVSEESAPKWRLQSYRRILESLPN